MNYFIESNLTRILFIFVIFVIVLVVLSGVYYILKRWFHKALHSFEVLVKNKIYILRTKISKKYKKILIAFSIIRKVEDSHTSKSVAIIYHFFVNFYENNKDEIKENWQLPETYFPNGEKDLADTYRWIKKIRKLNFEEYSNIDFDFSRKKFNYWGTEYQGLSYKIKDGQLYISPQIVTEYAHPENVFNKKYIQLQNDLYNLDSEMCSWIIDRRKFFNFKIL